MALKLPGFVARQSSNSNAHAGRARFGAVTQPLDASAPELTRCAAKQSNADRDATSRDHCRASLAVRGRSSHAAPRAKKYKGRAPVGQVQFQFQEHLMHAASASRLAASTGRRETGRHLQATGWAPERSPSAVGAPAGCRRLRPRRAAVSQAHVTCAP